MWFTHRALQSYRPTERWNGCVVRARYIPARSWGSPSNPALAVMPRSFPDEIIQIILNCLVDPSHFRLVSRRCYAITQDPYVRALYFISRYGRTQAFYYAFDRGKLLNEKVIDVRPHPVLWY